MGKFGFNELKLNSALTVTEVCDVRKLSGDFPVLVFTPKFPGIDKEYFFTKYLREIETLLSQFGSILFRHFEVESVDEFNFISKKVISPLMDYDERSTPRRKVEGIDNVYSSTEYHKRYPIYLHNENSYAESWPSKLLFWCKQQATNGGETLLADCRQIYRDIPESVRTLCESSEVIYTREFGEEVGISWAEAFSVYSREQLETKLFNSSYEWAWEQDKLTVNRKGPWVRTHPATKDIVWFNHALFFSESFIASQLDLSVTDLTNLRKYIPYMTSFTDSGIDANSLRAIKKAYDKNVHYLLLKRGDVLLIDNMIMAHGRAPYTGDRKVFVTMGQPLSN